MKFTNKIILKILLIILLFSIVFLVIIIYFKKPINNFFTKNEIEKITEEKTIFSIDKITFFSSATADINASANISIDNLSQYTDFALYINNLNSSSELTEKNTVKELYITNIQFNKLPELGTPNLYYKNINNFATNDFNLENKIENTLNFNITSNNNLNYEIPTLYNNCSNPITISYINSNILDTFTIANSNSTFNYNGTLLKKCNILLSSIACNLSFDIILTNNLDEKYKTTVNIDIPLYNENTSIYQDYLLLNSNVNFIFEKI